MLYLSFIKLEKDGEGVRKRALTILLLVGGQAAGVAIQPAGTAARVVLVGPITIAEAAHVMFARDRRHAVADPHRLACRGAQFIEYRLKSGPGRALNRLRVEQVRQLDGGDGIT